MYDGCATMSQLDVPTHHHRRSASYSHPEVSHRPAWQPVLSPYSSPSFRDQTGSVDMSRLSDIYREHAGDFWSTIAAKYSGGESLTPYELEQAFLNGRPSDDNIFEMSMANSSSDQSEGSLLSRDVSTSPNMLHLRHVRSANDMSIAGKCSVDSILNHGMY